MEHPAPGVCAPGAFRCGGPWAYLVGLEELQGARRKAQGAKAQRQTFRKCAWLAMVEVMQSVSFRLLLGRRQRIGGANVSAHQAKARGRGKILENPKSPVNRQGDAPTAPPPQPPSPPAPHASAGSRLPGPFPGSFRGVDWCATILNIKCW